MTAFGRFTASAYRKIYDGKMLNYSADGMGIESSAEFKKGAIVVELLPEAPIESIGDQAKQSPDARQCPGFFEAW